MFLCQVTASRKKQKQKQNMFLLLQHRQVLLEIFSKNYRVRRNMIQSRLTQECGEDLSKQELDKVLKVRAFRVQ